MKAMWSQWRIPWLVLVAFALTTLGIPSQVLTATLVDTLPLPTSTETAEFLWIEGDMLLVGARQSGGGLHCYDTATHQHQWTVDLGLMSSPPAGEGFDVLLVPSTVAVALDGSKVYAGTRWPGKLAVVDAITGQIGQSAEIPNPEHVFPQLIDGHDVIVIVTAEDVRVHDTQDIGIVHYLDALAGEVNGAVYDESVDSLFIAVHDPDLLVKYTFDWSGPVLQGSSTSVSCGLWPFDCKLVDGGLVAVACTEDGTVWTYDRTMLAHLSTYVGLTHLGSVGYYDGRILLVSYFSPPLGEDTRRGAVESLDPITGQSQTECFDNTYPRRVVLAPYPNACCVVDAGHEEWQVVPEDAGFTEVCSWVDGHLWTFDTQTLNLIDTEPLFGGHTLGASGGSQNLVYLISPDGMAIHVYSIP